MNNAPQSDLHDNRLIRFFDPETLEEFDDDSVDVGRYKWTDRELDVDLDLQYNRARFYDPTPGVWIGEEGPVLASPTGDMPACPFHYGKTGD